jgi:biotin operon repressor
MNTSVPALTPALRRVLRALAQSGEPHSYASLAAALERSPKALEKTVRALRHALADMGVAITRRRLPGETASRLYVAGDAALIGLLLGEPPATVQPASRRIETVTLPSVVGVTYAFSAEGRLIVGGEVQPVRAVC